MYYIGFFKNDLNRMMVFREDKIPTPKKYSYFGKVIGPYGSDSEARMVMKTLRRGYGYSYDENPAVSERQRRFMCADLGRKRAGKKTVTKMTEQQLRDFCVKRKKNPARVISHKQALALTKKVMAYAKKLYRHEQAGVRENPGAGYHDRKFLAYMKELEKYAIGSQPYIATLAKAYEHLESARASREESYR